MTHSRVSSASAGRANSTTAPFTVVQAGGAPTGCTAYVVVRDSGVKDSSAAVTVSVWSTPTHCTPETTA